MGLGLGSREAIWSRVPCCINNKFLSCSVESRIRCPSGTVCERKENKKKENKRRKHVNEQVGSFGVVGC